MRHQAMVADGDAQARHNVQQDEHGPVQPRITIQKSERRYGQDGADTQEAKEDNSREAARGTEGQCGKGCCLHAVKFSWGW